MSELQRIVNGWAERAPRYCPNGHRLEPGKVLVGTQHCDCDEMHRTHTCLVCKAVVFTPRLGERCRLRAFDERIM